MKASTAAKKMRELTDDQRNAAIEAAGNKVHDLRPYMHERVKQRAIAEGYKRPRFGDSE